MYQKEDAFVQEQRKCKSQGSKVMEFKNFIFQAWRVMEFNCGSLKVMFKGLFDRLVTADGKASSILWSKISPFGAFPCLPYAFP